MSKEQFDYLLGRLAENPPPEKPSYRDLRAQLEQLGETFHISEDVETETARVGNVPGLWLTAPGAVLDRVLLYAHGGGYVAGSSHSHGELTARLSRACGARVLSVDYRLAPEHPFPAARDDAVAAYRGLLSYRIPPERIVFGGDSAGGGVVMTALLALKAAGDPLPAGAVLLSPWIDPESTGESYRTQAEADPMVNAAVIQTSAKLYFGAGNLRDPAAAPLKADLTGLPPLLIEVGTHEVLLDDSTRLAERARAAGVDVTLRAEEGMIHVWQIFAPILDEGQASIDRIGKWVKERIA